MRILIVSLAIIFVFNFKTFSQNDSDLVIIDYIQEMPMFPGGYDSLWCVLENNFRYDILNNNQKNITFIIKFFIDSMGISKDFKFIGTRPQNVILNQADSLKIQEIYRVLSLLPKWEPAKQMNKKITIPIIIPIKTPYTEFRCKK